MVSGIPVGRFSGGGIIRFGELNDSCQIIPVLRGIFADGICHVRFQKVGGGGKF